MVEGEKRRFWIPKKLAYRGAPGKPEGMLVFDIELVEITEVRRKVRSPGRRVGGSPSPDRHPRGNIRD